MSMNIPETGEGVYAYDPPQPREYIHGTETVLLRFGGVADKYRLRPDPSAKRGTTTHNHSWKPASQRACERWGSGEHLAGTLTDAAVSKHIGNIFAKLGLRPIEENRRVRTVLTYLQAART